MTDIASIPPSIPKRRPHVVAVVLFDGVVPFDFTAPSEVFERARREDGRPAYKVKLCGVTREIVTGQLTLKPQSTLAALRGAQTIVLPGLTDIDQPIAPALIRAVRRAAERGARVASVCSGAFVLAATGLLDGGTATTHWAAASELARRFPAIEVDPNVLYVDNGNVLTSAGAAAAFDLCLHMVRRDFGAAMAADVARLSVMPLERAGGQRQFIQYAPPAHHGSLQPLLAWIEDHLTEDLSVSLMAGQAAMSERSLHRRFVDQVGTTPSQWVAQARVRRVQLLLESTDHSIEVVTAAAGFGSTANLRDQFQKIVGTSPSAYRRSFSLRAGTVSPHVPTA